MNIRERFYLFQEGFDQNEIMVKRKVDHTEGVAKIITGWNQSPIAEALGYYHDLGRFPQAVIYHTFKDRDSIDHAHLSYEILKENPYFLDGFNDEEKRVILLAIELHSRKNLPENLTKEERYWCDLIRSADVVENMQRFNRDYKNITGYTIEELNEQPITSEVAQNLKDHESVDNQFVKTGMDIVCRYLGFKYVVIGYDPRTELNKIIQHFSKKRQKELYELIEGE